MKKMILTKTNTVLSTLFLKTLVIIIVVSFQAPSAFAQTAVKGRVTDASGQPVINASITIKGRSSGVSSDERGNFQLSAPANATLVISSVEMLTKEVKVNGRSSINITLEAPNRDLEQVIVVGYGTSRKKDVTGAVVSISGATLKEVPAPNLIDQLKGRTAGVDIVSNSSTPGGGSQIRIRGNRTLVSGTNQSGSSNSFDQPLIVLDGVPYNGSINDVNPNDIASLEILKDASATAIYGSRGSGGVILISTKRGRSGKLLTTYEGYHGITKILDKLHVLNGQEYAQFKQDAAAYNRTSWPSSMGTSSYFLGGPELAAQAAGVSTDWQDLVYQQGFMTNHQLSVSGGGDKAQFGLGGGYFKEEGIIPNQDYDRYSLRATIDFQASSRIKFGINTINTFSNTNTPGGAAIPLTLMRLTPLASPYNADGSLNLKVMAGTVDEPFYINPLTLITKGDDILAKNRRIRTFNSLYAEVKILEGLRYRLNVGLNFEQNYGSTYNPVNTFVNSNIAQANSSANTANSEAWTYNIQHLLYYNKTFNEKHKIDFTGLIEYQKDHNEGSGFGVTGVPADYILNSNFGLATGPLSANANNTFYSERGLISYMGRLQYGFDNRYLLTATVRRDGSSTLSPGNQYFTYPAFSLGWNLSNEKFLSTAEFINNLKLRGGWGITSNQNVSPYSTMGLLTSGTNTTYNFGQSTAGQQPGYLVTSLPNDKLKWQSTAQWNVGLDFVLFKNRVSGSIDVYKQETKDILLTLPLPQSNGASSTIKNLGKTQGNGLEINLSTVNVQTQSGFTWTTDLNFYFNKEKIVQLQTPGTLQDISAGWFIGQPLTVIYDVKKIGIWQLEDSAKGILSQQTAPIQYPGQIRIEDINGDHKIDAADRQIIGNFQPKWEGGMTNRVAFKNFDLSIIVYARMGMKMLVPYVTGDGGNNGYNYFLQSRVNQLKVDYWTRSNPTNAFPAPDAGDQAFKYASTLAYMDGSFIKCRSINFGYALPTKILTKAGITSLRVYLNVTNPFIIYSPFVRDGFGPDPEGNGYGGAIGTPAISGSVPIQGRSISVNANNPSTRQFIFGLNLNF